MTGQGVLPGSVSVGPPVDAHQARVDLRGGPEDILADGAGFGDRTVEPGLHTGYAVDLRPGGRREPVGDLQLDHHEDAADRRELLQQVQQHRDRDVVGQVRDQGRRGGDTCLGQIRCGEGECVMVDDRDVVGAGRGELRDGAGKPCGEPLVELHGGHPACSADLLQQGEGQGAQPRADLDDVVVGGQLGGRDDAPDRVRVDDEVLPHLLRRGDVELCCQGPDLTGAQQAYRVLFAVRHMSRIACRGRTIYQRISQRIPMLAVQAGQAPQPCAAWTFSATAICSSREAM